MFFIDLGVANSDQCCHIFLYYPATWRVNKPIRLDSNLRDERINLTGRVCSILEYSQRQSFIAGELGPDL